VLGSRATDLLSGLGPPPLAPGEPVPLGEPGTVPAAVDVAQPPAMPDAPRLRLHPGPRRDWFTPEAERLLATAEYSVSERSNRIGVRLSGPVLPRSRTGELASEGLVLGAVEVTPGGELVVLLADHPTTGGYPVVAVVDPAQVPVAAQCRPGTRVRFAVGWA
jgi:allophanate hydrolase subunit 2